MLFCAVPYVVFVAAPPGGSLAELITRQEKDGADQLSENDLKQVLHQVAHGLRYIHSQHLVHLDIKPGSCHLADGRC